MYCTVVMRNQFILFNSIPPRHTHVHLNFLKFIVKFSTPRPKNAVQITHIYKRKIDGQMELTNAGATPGSFSEAPEYR